MGRVLRKENRIVFILFPERISFNLMLKRITLVGQILKNLKLYAVIRLLRFSTLNIIALILRMNNRSREKLYFNNKLF